jgi:hypothetical protein
MSRGLCVLAFFVLLVAGCSETFESRYSDWQKAQKDGAFERGWLPDWLPPSAADIREIHDLDTNAGAFSFLVPTSWSPPEAAGCVPSSQAAAPSIRFSDFPPNIEQRAGILSCGDLLVLVAERAVFAWR